MYRRADVEQVVRIKHLLLVEGLTLAGARRKLLEEAAPVAADAPGIDELIGEHARDRLTQVKRGLQSILELLAGRSTRDFRLTPPAPTSSARRVAASRARPRPKSASTAGGTRRHTRASRIRRGQYAGQSAQAVGFFCYALKRLFGAAVKAMIFGM